MDTGKSMLCFVAGAVAGAVAALFLAPDSGENTRAKIKRGAADLKGKAKEKIVEGLGIIEEALEESDGREQDHSWDSVLGCRGVP